MVYRDKRRDMARSVLPSTRRKTARVEKRAVHARVRARVRDALRDYDADEDGALWVDPQRDKPWSGIREVVRDRRYGDKLGPLQRWADANAERFGATPEERYVTLRAMLPPTIVGWHAMTHVERLEAYDRSPLPWRRRYRPRPLVPFAERVEALRSRLDARIVGLGDLNRVLKDAQPAGRYEFTDGGLVWVPWERRLWLGAHDTAEFAAWVLTSKVRDVVFGWLDDPR